MYRRSGDTFLFYHQCHHRLNHLRMFQHNFYINETDS
jgi:hypothetical protein